MDHDQATIADTTRLDRPVEPTEVRKSRRFAWPFWLIASDFLVARYAIAKGAHTALGWDSASYSYRPNEPRIGNLVSLTGHSPRLWGAPALFALFSTDQGRALAQYAIGTVAWLVLAWAVWRIPRNVVVKVVASGALLVLALTAQVTNWDFAILTESLSISLGILVLAGLLWWLHERSWMGLTLMTAAGFWWTFVRPELRLMVAALLVGLWIFALRHRERWRATAIASGVLAVAMIWCSLIVPVNNQTFPRWSAAPGATLQEETFYHRLGERIYADDEVRRIYEQRMGMPACPSLLAVMREKPGAVGFDEVVTETRRCPKLVEWIRAQGDAATVRFAMIAPGKFASEVWAASPAIWAGTSTYGRVPQILPGSVETHIFPSVHDDLWYLGIALLVAIGAAVVTGQWRRNRALLLGCVGVILTSIVSTVAALFLVSAELERQGIQETLFVRVAIVVLVALAADEVVARVRRESLKTPQPRRTPETSEGDAGELISPFDRR